MSITQWLKHQNMLPHLKFGVGLLLVVSYLLAIVALLRTDLLPGKYLGGVTLVTLVVIVGLSLLHKLAVDKR